MKITNGFVFREISIVAFAAESRRHLDLTATACRIRTRQFDPQWQDIVRLLAVNGLKLWLLTSGLSLAKHARRATELFDTITVSMDGTQRATYTAIRGLDAFDKVCEGIRAAVEAGAPVGLRVTLQRSNYRELPQFVALARNLATSARVILIDLALERPSLAGISTDPRAPGIADLARGTASFGQVITRDRFSRLQLIAAGRLGADSAAVYQSERIAVGIEALSRAYDHVIIDAGAAQSILSERIARLAPCAVLVAGTIATEKAEAVREHLAQSGFTDIAVFAGTPPALEADGMRGVAA